jgi:hypothetical protein
MWLRAAELTRNARSRELLLDKANARLHPFAHPRNTPPEGEVS